MSRSAAQATFREADVFFLGTPAPTPTCPLRDSWRIPVDPSTPCATSLDPGAATLPALPTHIAMLLRGR